VNNFPFINKSEQKIYFEQTASEMGLYAPYVEKDFWVCWVLNRLYSNSKLKNHITFKGGTSLSKVWGIIQRFSEDIDLTISRDFFGYGGDNSPENAPSNKQKGKRLKELRKLCQQYVSGDLLSILTEDFKENLPETLTWTLQVDKEDVDGQALLFEYPTNWPTSGTSYVKPVVKMEFGARSDPWPASQGMVKAFVAEKFPDTFGQIEIPVLALAAERTFWEKTMLLHEESFRPVEKPRNLRMARHYYDLWCLINNGVADKAMSDRGLFESVVAHRQVFFNLSWVDYSTLKMGRLKLVPTAEHMDEWKKDYEAMKEMFLGIPPSFEQILLCISDLEFKLNNS
jgi:Nucleotidyl transferase AbiEii toxin, Type IV TA system